MTLSLDKLAGKPFYVALFMATAMFTQAASGVDLVLYGESASTVSETLSAGTYAAQSFTTNGAIQYLTNVTTLFNSFRGGATTVEISLYNAGSPGTPGAKLVTFGTGSLNGINDFPFSFTPGTPIQLLPSTQYFIVAKVGVDDVRWYFGNQASVTTVVIPRPTFYSLLSNDGTNWVGQSTTRAFNLTVSSVPEPTTYALAAISAVTFAAFGRRKAKQKPAATA